MPLKYHRMTKQLLTSQRLDINSTTILQALYKTTDYGNTWTKINNGLPADAFTRVVREDDVRKDLLFAGTELGLFISWNGGSGLGAFSIEPSRHADNRSPYTQGKSDRSYVRQGLLDTG